MLKTSFALFYYLGHVQTCESPASSPSESRQVSHSRSPQESLSQFPAEGWSLTRDSVGNKMENIPSPPSWQRKCMYLLHGSFQTLNMRRIGGLQGGDILHNLVHRLVHCSANFQAHVRLPVRSRTAKKHFQDSVQVKIYLVA